MKEVLAMNASNNFRHRLNPLHVWCRLLRLHVDRDLARRICAWYEINLYRPTLGRRIAS